ncbi:hypothetical protein [Tenacibaculum sp. E3R01]|uniref:hypothetical protein n=1 Tax=Tenacibaculum sp. E3R01 TaxID=2267227 RepID=UPI00131476BA|nr:hypothetical protein [Tenacibaculum sp. E3R01]
MENFKKFALNMSQLKVVNGGEVPSNYELKSGNYGYESDLEHKLNTSRIVWSRICKCNH